MRPSTHCPLASASKQFTAACILLLRDDGKLSLDAPLSAYLLDYKDASRTTLRQALTMTSGIPVDDESCEAPVQGRVDDRTLIANLNGMKLDFEPGAHYAYSNCGYDLAGVVVARVSGMPFDRFVEERIFRPLGMSSSYMVGDRRETDFAEGYAPQGDGWKPAPLTAGDRIYASGNLASTAGDLQRWDRALLNATLLPVATLKEMFTVPALGSGARSIYAAGLFIEPNGAIWHAGGLAGYGTVNLLMPASGHAIVLLGNTVPHGRWKPWDVAREIYNALALGPAMAAFEPMRATTLPK
jgi:CubicO group peptidase (beta-lactamase class C family)